jgi:hypothetical protein
MFVEISKILGKDAVFFLERNLIINPKTHAYGKLKTQYNLKITVNENEREQYLHNLQLLYLDLPYCDYEIF